MIPILPNAMFINFCVLPLQDICLDFVAENICHYDVGQLADLPHPSLLLLTKYLSAYGLYQLHDVFLAKGIDTEVEWQKCLERQCPHRFQKPVSLFSDKYRGRRDRRPSRSIFMERHFRHIVEKMGKDVSCLSDALQARPFNHSAGKRCSQTPLVQQAINELRNFAVAVEILTVNASDVSQVSSLISHPVSEILQQTVRRIDFHFLTRHTFVSCLELAERLVSDGKVAEVSLVQSNLDCLHVTELFRVLSSRRGKDFEGTQETSLIETAIESSNGSTLGTGLVDMSCNERISDSQEQCSVIDCEGDGVDLFDVALMPSGFSTEVGRLHMDNVNIGLEGLSLVNCRYGGVEFEELLCSLLRTWNALRKLAIIGTTKSMVEYEKPLCDAVQRGWLTHLVLDCCGFSENFLSTFLLSVLNKSRHQPLEQLSLLFPDNFPVHINSSVLSELNGREFHGTVHLDLSHNHWSGLTEGLEFIEMWLRNDLGLKRVTLKQFDAPHLIGGILNAIQIGGHLESVNLQGVSLSQRSHQDAIVSILHSTPILKKLNIRECNLPASFVAGGAFIDAVTSHRELVRLNVAANRLEESACALLKAIYCRTASVVTDSRFEKLNISFNHISSASLLRVAAELVNVETHNRPPIIQLDISGNPFDDRRQEIVRRLGSLVSKVVGLTMDFTSEHLSQM